MAKQLNAVESAQRTAKTVQYSFTVTIGGSSVSNDLISWRTNADTTFGSTVAELTLNNPDGKYSSDGTDEITVGDNVSIKCQYGIGQRDWDIFEGEVFKTSIIKAVSNTISVQCLDKIAKLKHTDINATYEADKVRVSEETLTPNYFSPPNEKLSQVFDFANDALAQSPPLVLKIKDKNDELEEPRYKGFEVNYEVGQVKMGMAINSLENYDVIAREYHYYPKGLYFEDVLENIIKEPDGYGNYLYGYASASEVVDNVLTETFTNVTGESQDNLTFTSMRNYTISHQLAGAVTAGDTSITLTSIEGLPSSGTGSINGDQFIWTSITSGNVLTGIPATGDNALKDHAVECYVDYTGIYDIGQIWLLSYNNIITSLTESDFTFPSGATIDYINLREGLVIFNTSLDPLDTVTCDTNYSFKTLQATGIEISKFETKERQISNRFEAISKLREFVAPNYIIHTKGTNKIWATYMVQKDVADYTLDLETSLDYMGDQDIYTRVVVFGENANPTNLVYDESVSFVTTGESYIGTTVNTELRYVRMEGDFVVYASGLPQAGEIVTTDNQPIVYINGTPIDNDLHYIPQAECYVKLRIRTETTQEGGK